MKNPGVQIDSWIGGCNSLLPPEKILVSQYAWLINGVNRGGLAQTRPGLDQIGSILGVKAQGAGIFTPQNSRPMMLVAVDGYIYAGKYPFTSFSKVDGLKFEASAPIITFQRCVKSVNLNPDGSLSLVEGGPIPLMIIQDNVTKPGRFDGSFGVHSTSGAPFYGVPIGLWMAWASSRLWVFKGNRGFVSDLANPDTFSEGMYLAERDGFDLPDTVTGVIETSDEKSLLAFTNSSTTAFKSHIRDRTLWQQTADFQKEILPSIGCVAGRSPTNQYGMTWWFSNKGWINLDAALFTEQTSKLVTVDGEMMRSKRIMADDKSFICSAHLENFLLVSVPSGGRYNEQTWVADQAPVGQAGNGSGMVWSGIWTGVRPVQWLRATVFGRERLFFLSYDATIKDNTKIHIWEAFNPSRQDNGGRILCQLTTGMMKSSELGDFKYAEFEVIELLGVASLQVYVGGSKGPFYKIFDSVLQAEIGSLKKNVSFSRSDTLQAFKPQSRTLKTNEFSPQDKECLVETDVIPGKDKGFQLLFEWNGRMGIGEVKFVIDPDPSEGSGECPKSEAGEHNAIDAGGEKVVIE